MSRKPKAKKQQSQNSVAFAEAVDHQSGLSQRLKDTLGADPGSAAISNTVQGMELPFLRHRRAAPCESSKCRIHSPGSAARSFAGAQRCGRATAAARTRASCSATGQASRTLPAGGKPSFGAPVGVFGRRTSCKSACAWSVAANMGRKAFFPSAPLPPQTPPAFCPL